MAKTKREDMTPLQKRRSLLAQICGSISGLLDQIGRATYSKDMSGRVQDLLDNLGKDLSPEDREELATFKQFLDRTAAGFSYWRPRLEAIKPRLWDIR